MFEYCEIIKILIVITNVCAPPDMLVQVLAVFFVFGNPAKERFRRNPETVIYVKRSLSILLCIVRLIVVDFVSF